MTVDNSYICFDLDAALELLAAARTEAERRGLAIAAVVTDPGGNLVAASRMDGAPFGVVTVALDKAYTSVAFGVPSGDWAESTAPGAPDWGFQGALGGRMAVYPGGVPLVRDGVIVGAIGVSGGEGHEDLACAEAAAAALGMEGA